MSAATDLILRIENNFAQLRKEYTLFLNDVNTVEPYELRNRLEADLKRLRNMNNLRTEENFRSQNIIAKVNSHLQLWKRQVERKISGDPVAAARMARMKAKKQIEDKQTEAKKGTKKSAPKKRVVISDVGNQRERVVELYDEYMRLNLMLGARKMANFAKFQTFIAQQTEKIQSSKKVNNVAYEVSVQDEKVVIRSRSTK
ncbi:hypothetical protein [Acanthopleuribacter pedis]|uniref:Uncharacterized protein n=1 Tax=Acanthopleuribacter pedis TaxID=442870 RepID=A0A8J7Q7W3_9BACT|nr:hypothetical protein [Acanthopleuribacter pedis]MBO1320026.1 hypothetical protein [Acanthopleuribacter pedis]